jgi:hypothetical protein
VDKQMLDHPGLSLGRSLSSEEAQFVDRMDHLTTTRLRAMEERLSKKMEASNRLISDMQAVQLKQQAELPSPVASPAALLRNSSISSTVKFRVDKQVAAARTENTAKLLRMYQMQIFWGQRHQKIQSPTLPHRRTIGRKCQSVTSAALI